MVAVVDIASILPGFAAGNCVCSGIALCCFVGTFGRFDQFVGLIKHTKNSAPGPNGVPYAALRNSPLEVYQLLYEAYLDWLDGAPLPPRARGRRRL